jgi:hypothetical protein
MEKVTLEMTVDQTHALTRMLDLATRIHMCQFGEISYHARTGEIKKRGGELLTDEETGVLEYLCARLSNIFGFEPNSSHGIGAAHVSKDAKRGWETKKVIEKALAMHKDPNPVGIRGVNYDGLSVRYTQDPAPVATVADA